MIGLKGWVQTILAGLVLLAGAVLIALQWDSTAKFLLYGKRMEPNTAVLILLSMAGGVALPFLVKTLMAGIRNIASARRKSAAKQTD